MSSRPFLWAGLLLASVAALALAGGLLDETEQGGARSGVAADSARNTSLDAHGAKVGDGVNISVPLAPKTALAPAPALDGEGSGVELTATTARKQVPASLTVDVVIVCNAPKQVFVSLEPTDRSGSSQLWYEGSPLTWTDLPPGEYRVTVVPDEGIDLVSQRVQLEPGVHSDVTMVAPNTSAVAGTVVDEEGDPVQAFIWRIETGSEDMGVPQRGSGNSARSDGGHFCVPQEELPYEGVWRVAVHTTDGSTATSPWYDMAETSEVHDMMLVLAHPARITGVVSAEGRVLPDAIVRVVATSESEASELRSIPEHLGFDRTDDVGHFDISLERGRLVRLRVSHSDYLPWQSEPLHLPAGGAAITVNARLFRGGRLVGKVLWEGMPNEDGWARVSASTEWRSDGSSSVYKSSPVDRLGNFTIDGLPEEILEVELWTTPALPGFPSPSNSVEIHAGQTTELTIDVTFDLDALLSRPKVVIELRRPPELADELLWIHVVNEEGQPIGEYEGLTMADTLTVYDLPTGPITVYATTLPDEPGLESLASATGSIPEAGSAAPVVIDLAASLLEIHLGTMEAVDFLVEPVDASSTSAPGNQPMYFSSDEFGRCRLFGLAHGAYAVSCPARPGVRRSVTVGARPARVSFR